ncbi:hypothetical protein ACFFT9_20860, partial [Chromobacterium violaceum]|uniref:hypothetical protein n=1 Tax=Chromobacterium violaceum TaxID=536 RepID=UPI0035EC2733
MYLIDGELRADLELDAALSALRGRLPDALAAEPDVDAVLSCAERFAAALAGGARHPLLDEA